MALPHSLHRPAPAVLPGISVLLEEHPHLLRGRRIGLVSHPAAVLPDLTHTLDALMTNSIHVTALFGPEHGFSGAAPDAEAVPDGIDPHYHLPVFSLYGAGFDPPPEALDLVDVLLFDMQDIGCRFYTFISTLHHLLRTASTAGIPLIACDRPNPLGGLAVEGPGIEPGYRSFIGTADIPVRHGLTIGELAQLFNAGIGADLTVIPMRGWQRGMVFADTRLPWVPTSPGMPTTATAMVYPGTCLLEGTSISEGRGTTLPFELVGAPWLDGYALASELNSMNLPGLRFRPAAFTPISSKFAGTTCGGVQVHVLDPGSFQPLLAGISLLSACLRQQPEHVTFLPDSWEGTHPHFDLLAGSSDLRRDLLAVTAPEEIAAGWKPYEDAFRTLREPYLLY